MALSSLTGFVARSTRITADWLNGVDKALVGLGEKTLDGHYGGKADDSTDNTTAIQAAFDDHATWGKLKLNKGIYRISAPIEIDVTLIGKIVQGAGKYSTFIKQMTDGEPIFVFTKKNTQLNYLSDIGFTWANQQDGSDTDAYAIQFAQDESHVNGFYFNHFERLFIDKAYIGIGTKDISGRTIPVWGCSFRDINMQYIHHRCIDLWSPSVAGQPHNTFHNIAVANNAYFLASGAANDAAFRGNALEATFTNIDLEGWNGPGFFFSGGNPQHIQNLHVEHHRMRGSLPYFLFTATGQTVVDGYNWVGDSDPSSSPARIFLVGSGAQLTLRGAQAVDLTITSGTARFVQAQSGAQAISIETPVRNDGGAISIPTLATDTTTLAAIRSYDGYQRRPSAHTFTASDTTPSVALKSVCKTANGSATSITTFDDGVNGQVIHVHLDANTTLVHSTGLNLSGGDDITGTASTIVTLYYDGTNWYETARRT